MASYYFVWERNKKIGTILWTFYVIHYTNRLIRPISFLVIFFHEPKDFWSYRKESLYDDHQYVINITLLDHTVIIRKNITSYRASGEFDALFGSVCDLPFHIAVNIVSTCIYVRPHDGILRMHIILFRQAFTT